MTSSYQFAAPAVAESRLAEEPAVLSRVRLRARRRALWLRKLWSSDENLGQLAITHGEADRLLVDPLDMRKAERGFYEMNDLAHELGRLITLADHAAEEDRRWRTLLRMCGVGPQESDLLALAILVVADPQFVRVCAYLQDDATAGYATPFLAAALFGWPTGAQIPANSGLLRWRMASVPESVASAPNAPWTADPWIVQWLLGGQAVEATLEGALERMAAGDVARLECLDPATLENICDFLAKMLGDAKEAPPAIEIELIAPEGAGKRTLAAQVCAGLSRDLLVADPQALQLNELVYPQRMERIVRAARTARLQGAALYWAHAELLDAHTRSAMGGLCDLTFFGSSVLTTQETDTRTARRCFHMKGLRPAQRVRLWLQYTGEPALPVIREWELRPGEIRAAARAASNWRWPCLLLHVLRCSVLLTPNDWRNPRTG